MIWHQIQTAKNRRMMQAQHTSMNLKMVARYSKISLHYNTDKYYSLNHCLLNTFAALCETCMYISKNFFTVWLVSERKWSYSITKLRQESEDQVMAVKTKTVFSLGRGMTSNSNSSSIKNNIHWSKSFTLALTSPWDNITVHVSHYCNHRSTQRHE